MITVIKKKYPAKFLYRKITIFSKGCLVVEYQILNKNSHLIPYISQRNQELYYIKNEKIVKKQLIPNLAYLLINIMLNVSKNV